MPDDYAADEGMDKAVDLVERVLDEAGAERERVLGVGHGHARPDPPDRHGRLVVDPPRLGRHARRKRAWRTLLAVAGAGRATTPTSARWPSSPGAPGAGCSSVVYLKLATGIGAGIVIDGRLFEGAGGTAGEIGHTTIDETGDICRCGNRGCLETYAGAAAIASLLVAQPRRRARARRRGEPRPRGRRRLSAGVRRRRPLHRRGGGEPVQSVQPGADRRRGQHGCMPATCCSTRCGSR